MKHQHAMIVAAIAAFCITMHAAAQELTPGSMDVRVHPAARRAWSGVSPDDASELCILHHKDEPNRVGTELLVTGRKVVLVPGALGHRCARADIKAGDGILIRGPELEPKVWILLAKPRPRTRK